MIGEFLGMLLGGGRNAVRETVEVFRPNAEADAQRAAAQGAAALAQFAAEFGLERRGWFDRFIDGLNRLPRPMLALGTLGLFVAAMVDPVWFAARMTGIALVPEPMWWLMGAIVSFYFGARHQAKTQDLQRSLAETLARTPAVARQIEAFERMRDTDEADDGPEAEAGPDVAMPAQPKGASGNAALDEWRRGLGH